MAYREGEEPVPGYRLEAFLGRGGFGEVWKADGPGGTPAAIKFISLSGKQGLKEFRALGLVKRIRHPNLVPITAFWLKDRDGRVLETEIGDSITQLPSKAAPGQPAELIIAMGLGDRNLLDRLEQCREEGLPGVPADELLDYLEDAARAIDYMNSPVHDLGHGAVAVQHCDIKPQNIMIVGGAAQVCDFGLARALDDVRVTTAAGSPAYGAPECLEGNKPSASTDQYSLAISYVELRTGELPFADQSLMGVINAHLQGMLDLSRLSSLEREVILKATSRNPDERFPNTQKMIRALRRAVEGSSPGALLAEQAVSVANRPAGVMSLAVGAELVPGFRLVKHVVRGGTNDVWEASAPGGRSVAMLVRRLDPERDSVDLGALGAIQTLEEHPNLADVQAYWLLSESGSPVAPDASDAIRKARWLVITGKLAKGTLLDRLEECRRQSGWGIPTAELLAYMDQVAKAVDFLNAPRHTYGGRTIGLAHGNLRPVNFLLFGDLVRLGNFGRATLLEGDLTKLTHAVGFEHPFTPPEVLLGRVSRWSDQYGLAIAYVQLRTGRLPFPATASTTELLDLQKKGKLDLSALTPAEEKVVARATQVEPKKRFPNCEAFVTALRGSTGVSAAAPTSKKAAPPKDEEQGGVAVATAADTSIDPLRATMPTSAGETPIDSGLLPELVRSVRADNAATATMLLAGETEPAVDDPAAAARGTLMAPGSTGSATPGSKSDSRAPGWQKKPAERSRRGLYIGGAAVLAVAVALGVLLRPKPEATPKTPERSRVPDIASSDPPPDVTPVPRPEDSPAAKLLTLVNEQRASIDSETLSKLPNLENAAGEATRLNDPQLQALAALGCRQALARLDRWSDFPKHQVAERQLVDPQDRAIAATLALLADAKGEGASATPPRVASLLELWPQRESLPPWEREKLVALESQVLTDGRDSLAGATGNPESEIALADQLLKLAPQDARLLDGKAVQQVRAKRVTDALATFRAAETSATDDAERQSIQKELAAVEAIQALGSQPDRAPALIEQVAATMRELPVPIAGQLLASVLEAAPQASTQLRPAALKVLKAGSAANLLDQGGRKAFGDLLTLELTAGLKQADDPQKLAALSAFTTDLRDLDRADPLARLVDIECRVDAAATKPLSPAQIKSDLTEVHGAKQTPGLAAYADYLTARLAALESSGAATAADALVAAAHQPELPEWLLSPWRRQWSTDRLVAAASSSFALPETGWLPGLAESPFQGDGAAKSLKYFEGAARWAPADFRPARPQLLCEAFAAWYAPKRDAARTLSACDALLTDSELPDSQRSSLALLRAEAAREAGRPAAEVLAALSPIADSLRTRHDYGAADGLLLMERILQPTLAWAETQAIDDNAARANLSKLYSLQGSLLYRFGDTPEWKSQIKQPTAEELKAYDHAVTLAPSSAELHAYRGFAQLRQSPPNLDAAEVDAKSAVDLDPNHPAGHGLQGMVSLKRSRTLSDPVRRFELAESAAGPCDEAIRISRASRGAPEGQDYSDRLETYLINASVARVDAVNLCPPGQLSVEAWGERLAKAAELGKEAAALNEPFQSQAFATTGNALEDLAWIVGKVENYEPAITAFTGEIQTDPTPAGGFMNRGRCHFKRVRDGKQDRAFLDNAIADLKQALVEEPNYAEAHYWLGLALAQKSGWATGLKDLSQAVEKSAETPGNRALFALDWSLGAYEAALRASLEESLASGADKPKRKAEATSYLADCQKAAELLNPRQATGLKALSLIQGGKLTEAAALLKEPMAAGAAKATPGDSLLMTSMVRLRRKCRDNADPALKALWNPQVARGEADAAHRLAATSTEKALAIYEAGFLGVDLLTVLGTNATPQDREQTSMILRAALAQDDTRAEATIAREGLLSNIYSQLLVDAKALPPAKGQALKEEALALIEKVRGDLLATPAMRKRALDRKSPIEKKTFAESAPPAK